MLEGYHEAEGTAQQILLESDVAFMNGGYLRLNWLIILIPVPIPKIEDLRYPLLSPGIVRPPVTVPYVNFPPFEGALEREPRYSPSMILASNIRAPEHDKECV